MTVPAVDKMDLSARRSRSKSRSRSRTEANEVDDATPADDPSLDYAQKQIVRTVAAFSLASGFRTIHESSLTLLSSLMEQYIRMMCRKTMGYAEICGRTVPNVADTIQAMMDLKIDVYSMANFAKHPNPARLKLRGMHTSFPVALEKLKGWEEIPPNFHNQVPPLADVQKEGVLRYLEAAKLWPPKVKDRSGRPEFPDFSNMTARQLGFFKPHEKTSTLPICADDSCNTNMDPDNNSPPLLHSSEESWSCNLAVDKDSTDGTTVNSGPHSTEESSYITKNSSCEETKPIRIRKLKSPGTESYHLTDRIPLGPHELCMVSNEISARTNLPNVVIRINRRLMEKYTAAAAKLNSMPPPRRVKKRGVGRPICKRKTRKNLEDF